jgi:hypothetical protein
MASGAGSALTLAPADEVSLLQGEMMKDTGALTAQDLQPETEPDLLREGEPTSESRGVTTLASEAETAMSAK